MKKTMVILFAMLTASVVMAQWQAPLVGTGTNTITITNPRGEYSNLRYIQIGVTSTNGGDNAFVAWLCNTNSDLSMIMSNRIYAGTLVYTAGGVGAQTNVLSTMSLPVPYFWKAGDYLMIGNTNAPVSYKVWVFSQK